ncbi:uncharacterized protein MELLADRAFT_88556 [Melampsora larici-populina 98AG31]|uniref:Uncharacterized protein n=1 Tax=Melampsora larici-populina (strain 98AG31 / pathotype 3-4-7) TaxID=747676 RepID=F4RS66_MELLP|nr:uncharacterized protein MELLADRAFT_88556 [Melampsora larici-populina 98AG31]EGG04832.1 hypothetical protein MELLADRAFT_88556 [Melampsora larici-populina 98AG31]
MLCLKINRAISSIFFTIDQSNNQSNAPLRINPTINLTPCPKHNASLFEPLSKSLLDSESRSQSDSLSESLSNVKSLTARSIVHALGNHQFQIKPQPIQLSALESSSFMLKANSEFQQNRQMQTQSTNCSRFSRRNPSFDQPKFWLRENYFQFPYKPLPVGTITYRETNMTPVTFLAGVRFAQL